MNVEDEALEKRGQITVNYTYPNNLEYDYTANMERINFDEERERDIANGEGFIISSPKATIKKDIKDPNGIFSQKFGQSLGDLNPYMDRYSCECGYLKSRINNGRECPKCHTLCKYVDDDYHMFGWMVLNDEYPIIHPDIYKQLDQLFGRSKYDKESHNREKGSKLKNILNYDIPVDINGNYQDPETAAKPDEPWYGRGMIYFHEHFDEIANYYYTKNPKKKDIYDDIMLDRDKIFTHSIPVFTSHLRPVDISAGSMYFEKCTALYNMMAQLVHRINKANTRADRNIKAKDGQLYKLQMKYMELYDEIVNILNGKRGQLRMLVGGRYNFSSRCVIRQDPQLRIDQIKLPYTALVIIMKDQIENMLHRMYNISFQEAYDRWTKAVSEVDPLVVKILETLIKRGHINPITGQEEEGIAFIINRNPTISYGGILQMFCTGININNYTMSVNLQILKLLAADFDGDVLNIFMIINQAFFERAFIVFNPRNAMYISRSNGMCNKDVLIQRDTLINANTLEELAEKDYTPEELDRIKRIKEKNKKVINT